MNLDAKYRICGRYQSGETNQDIVISHERVRIEGQSNTFEGEATIAIKHRPQPRLEVDIPDIPSLDFLDLLNVPKVKINFCARNVATEAYVVTFGPRDEKFHLVALPIKLPVVTGPSQPLSAVLFHVINFHNFMAPTDLVTINEDRSGRAIIEVDGFRIIIDADEKIQELAGSLHRNGGYAITHNGSLVTRNGNPFSAREAENLLEGLHYFLSFCRGSWVDAFLPIGLNANGEVCWEQWGLRQVDPWQARVSWFDEHHGGLLGEVFPGFWQLWKDEQWRDPIRTTIYWYVSSSNPRSGTDGSIILTQAALEQLAWVFLVEYRKALSLDGFEKLPAADQIRLLLSTLKIPASIPSELKELEKVAKEHNWDGPAALTEIRNSIVHPGKMEKQKRKLRGSRLPVTDTWSLGLWYVELALLSLFQHKGVYARRLQLPHTPGTVTNVPWASEDT
jgi:hypothetical protein